MTPERRAALIRYGRAHPTSLANDALVELERVECERDALDELRYSDALLIIRAERRISELKAEVATQTKQLQDAIKDGMKGWGIVEGQDVRIAELMRERDDNDHGVMAQHILKLEAEVERQAEQLRIAREALRETEGAAWFLADEDHKWAGCGTVHISAKASMDRIRAARQQMEAVE